MKILQISRGIWSYRLSPGAFRLYCAMLGESTGGWIHRAAHELKAVSGIGMGSIATGTRELVRCDLLTPVREPKQGRIAPYRFQPVAGDGFLCLPRHILAWDGITPSSLMVYACMLSEAGPSGTTEITLLRMAAVTGLSESTVMHGMKRLIRIGLIHREYRYLPGGAVGANRYHILEPHSLAALRAGSPQEESPAPETIPVDNAVWSCGLSPGALRLYLAARLLPEQARTDVERLAEVSGYSTQKAAWYLEELLAKEAFSPSSETEVTEIPGELLAPEWTDNTVVVYSLLLSLADGEGISRTGLSGIMAAAGLSGDSVLEALNRLEAEKRISRERNGNRLRTACYRVYP